MDRRLTRRVAGALKAGIDRLPLARVPEPRQAINRRWSLRQLLAVTLAGLVAGCHNLAQVEALTAEMSTACRRLLGIGRRVADTTLRDLLVRLDPTGLRNLLAQQIRQIHRSHALDPVGLPFGAVAMDGKGTAIDSWEAGFAQRQVHGGSAKGASGLVRTFTCSLMSSLVPVCLDAAPIPPDTNEDGCFAGVLDRLVDLYGAIDLFRLIVADAGSCSLANASHVRDKCLHYLFRLNDKQPTLFTEAQRCLQHLSDSTALANTSEAVRGAIEDRRIWVTTEMAGFLEWTHLVTVIRVQRSRTGSLDPKNDFVHDRYFMTSLRPDALTAKQWLHLIRNYWAAVENGAHNILDTAFQEDNRPWITGHDQGMLNVLLLRRIALNLVGLFRGRTQRGEEQRATPWTTIIRWFRNTLIAATPDLFEELRPRRIRIADC